MAIRYSAKLFEIYGKIRQAVNESDLPDDQKNRINAMISYGEGYMQAGHLIASGRTIKGFEALTGLTVEQMKETAQYKEIAKLMVGDTITISCPRPWFNFIRSLLKSETPNIRLRTKKGSAQGEIIITRMQ